MLEFCVSVCKDDLCAEYTGSSIGLNDVVAPVWMTMAVTSASAFVRSSMKSTGLKGVKSGELYARVPLSSD